jgi:hypothetical protein
MKQKPTWREQRAACKKEIAQALATGGSVTEVLARHSQLARDPSMRVGAYPETKRGYQRWDKRCALWGLDEAARAKLDDEFADAWEKAGI